MGIIKKIATKLPVISYLNYSLIGWKKDKEKNKSKAVIGIKFTGHLIYASASLSAIAFYSITGIETHEWNPIQQRSAITKQSQEIIAEREKYNSLWKRIFSVNGLADTDKNGSISYEEQFDAWNKMDLINLNKVYFETDGKANFPKPKTQDLEKAVQSYEAEKLFEVEQPNF